MMDKLPAPLSSKLSSTCRLPFSSTPRSVTPTCTVVGLGAEVGSALGVGICVGTTVGVGMVDGVGVLVGGTEVGAAA